MNRTIIIALATHKGGSGKTSTTQNLGYGLAELGYKVLMIDTDSQSNLSRCYEVTKPAPYNFYNCFVEGKPILEAISHTEYKNLDIIRSSVKLTLIEAMMAPMSYREDRMEETVRPLRELSEEDCYDFILMDTNPSLALYNTAIISLADQIIVPVEPSIFGIDGLEIFNEYLDTSIRVRKNTNILGVVLNRVEPRTIVARETLKTIEEMVGAKLFETQIRQDVNVKAAQWAAKPAAVYSMKKYFVKTKKGRKKCRVEQVSACRAAEDYKRLAMEVVERCQQN